MKRSRLVGISLISILLLLSTWAFGQAISGDLVGVVKDSTGALVPHAEVTATNMGTNAKSVQQTNAEGEYHFVNLPVAQYTLAAAASGMAGSVQGVSVELNKRATVDITMFAAGTATTVEVSEEGATIDSTTPTISTTFTAKDSQDLPITGLGGLGSGVLNLSLLNPGVASSGGVGAGSGPSVGGNRPRNNNFSIEGVDNNSLSVTGPLISIPNDAVGSFTVLQNQFSSEFGHSSGGQFNQTIKSGTNTFHGSAYEYFQNRKLNAEDSQVAMTQAPGPYSTPRYDNNRYGGNFGGPILKNKLFFFTDWEYNAIGQAGTPSTGCAPTAAGYTMLNNLFPGSTNLQQMEKYLPASTTGATVCSSSIQVAAGQRSVLPNGNTNPLFAANAVNIPVGDVGFIGPSYQNYLNTANSFDWVISQNDSMRGRLAYTKNTGFDTNAQLPTFWLTLPTTYWLATLAEYHNFGTSVNNEFRFGFNRYANVTATGSQTFPGLGPGTFPNLVFLDLNGVNLGPDPNAPQETIQNIYSFVDNVSWVKGKHNFRFGGEFRWIISPQTFTQRVRGDYEWSQTTDYLNDFSPNPDTGDFAERSSGNVVYYGNKKAVYAYANDEWRLTPTFTLNLGLRYEYTGEPQGTQLQALNAISSVPGLINFSAPTADKTNFLPRVGLAWAPNPETSVRVGYALQSDVIYDNLGILSLPPQVQQTCDTTSLTNYAPTSGCFWAFNKFLASGGLPSVPGQITDPATARANTGAYIPNQTLPYAETFTAGIQRQFGKAYTLEVRFVSTRGIKLPVQTRLNRTSPVQPWAYLPTYLSMPSQATLDSLPFTLGYLKSLGNAVPAYANAGFVSNIVSFQPLGASKYNGMDVQFSRTFTNGLQFQVAYTWSHLLDNSTADVFSTVLTPRRPQDFQCFNCDYGTSALDRRQRFTAFAVYDLPFFKNDNWFMKNVVGNWQFSPIYTLQAPEYATCQSAVDSNLNGDSASDRCIYNPAGVPNTSSTVTGLRNSSGATVAYLADNPTAQYITAGAGTFTTAGRNSLGTPWTNNWDISALKRINITERQAISFSVLAVNLFNHAQYVPGFPVVNDVQSFGQTAGPVRNTLIPGSATFANWPAAFSNHPRQLVLVVKYNF
jgi:outer membrane receptor protein involved in Fe transport